MAYELIQVSEHDYYIDCPVKIGLVRISEQDVVLIDSGGDKDAGKKIYRLLNSNGWTLKAIFNTHSHADHIGGNHFLQDKTGCPIYSKGLECVYSNQPILEPIGLYGGLPFKELRSKFLMAQQSNVLPLERDVLPKGMRLLDLPGHCFEMVGFLTSDSTAYIADSVFSEETLRKYGIGYLWDIDAAVKTLESLLSLDAVYFIPSHAPASRNIESLVKLNIEKLNALKESILNLCAVPVSFEALLKKLFQQYGMTMNAQQYVLIGSTVRSCLSSLYAQRKVTFDFCENEMLWKSSE